MILSDGKARCDAEIGSVKTRWRQCDRPAAIEAEVRTNTGHQITLHYCERHAKRAKGPTRKL